MLIKNKPAIYADLFHTFFKMFLEPFFINIFSDENYFTHSLFALLPLSIVRSSKQRMHTLENNSFIYSINR